MNEVYRIGDRVGREGLDRIGAWHRTVGDRAFAMIDADVLGATHDLLFVVEGDEAIAVMRHDPRSGFEAFVRDERLVENALLMARSQAMAMLLEAGFEPRTYSDDWYRWVKPLESVAGRDCRLSIAGAVRGADIDTAGAVWSVSRSDDDAFVQVSGLDLDDAIASAERIPEPAHLEKRVLRGIDDLEFLIAERSSTVTPGL